MKNLLLSIAFSLFAATAHAAGTIVLMVDISSSINNEQMNLQIDSYALAMQTIPTLQYVDIEVVLFSSQPVHLVSGTSSDAAKAFTNYKILGPETRGTTCLNNALLYVEKILPNLKQPVVIDISGDGEANCSNDHQLNQTLDRIADTGAKINTLYIENTSTTSGDRSVGNPYLFYQQLVRNDGFTIQAAGFEDFEIALYEKLILEIGMLLKK